jgi:hypothetical protein
MNDMPEREAKALDALIAGALLPECKSQNLSATELDALLAGKYCTLPEDQAALNVAGNPFLNRAPARPTAAPSVPLGTLAMAMNRKNAVDQLSEQTRKELERKARELLG